MRLVALALAAAPVAAQDSDLHNQAKDIGSKAVDAIGGLISGAGSAIGKGISSGIDHLKGQFTPPPSPAPLSPPSAPPPSPFDPPHPLFPPPVSPPSLPPASPPFPPSPPMPPYAPMGAPPGWIAIAGIAASLIVIAIAGTMVWRAGNRRRGDGFGGSVGQEIGGAPAQLTFAGSSTTADRGCSAAAKSKKKRAEIERARQRNPQTFSALEALAQANAQAMAEDGGASSSTTQSSYVPPALAVMAPLEPTWEQSRC